MTEAKSITNIYYDCLERIFDFLNLESLLNVAGTCKRLQIAAAAKFGDKYGDRHIHLDLCKGNGIVGNVSNIDDTLHGLITVQREVCLPFLRCFGAKILYLFVDNKKNPNDNSPESKLDILGRYVNQYCADTLTGVQFRNLPFSIDLFQKSFKNVGTVFFHGNDLKDQLPNFVNWFPNMRCLKMRIIAVDKNTTEVSFPLLEQIVLEINDKLMNEYAKLLHANEQLKDLKILLHKEITMSNLLDMISGNTAIWGLCVYTVIWHRTANVTKAELNRLANEHPMMNSVYLYSYCLSADDVITFLGQVQFLKKCVFHVKDRPEFDRLSNQLANEWQINGSLGINGEQRIFLSKGQS